MAEQQQQQQTGHNSRPPFSNMSATTSGRRSNLRLAFPGQPRPTNDHQPNDLEFPASGYPATPMSPDPEVFDALKKPRHPRASPPPVPPRITISNASANRERRSKSSPGGGVRAACVTLANHSLHSDGHVPHGSPVPPVRTRATQRASPSPPPHVRIPQNVREQKKKTLILHLPPPHHHGQHHRHESLRDRSHKR